MGEHDEFRQKVTARLRMLEAEEQWFREKLLWLTSERCKYEITLLVIEEAEP